MRTRHAPAAKRARLSRVAVAAALIGLAPGCGDSPSTPTEAGGAGGVAGAGGTGGASAGAPGDSGRSDGPRPPSAQGAVSLHIAEKSDPNLSCAPGRHWINAPSTPGPNQMQQTSGSEIGTRAVDGVAEARVKCTVRKSGEAFDFEADITTPRIDGTQRLHPTVLHFDASMIVPTGPPAKGTVTAMTERTLANFADDQCAFSVTPQPGISYLDVDPGKIWASVTCDQFAHPEQPEEVCALDAGFLVFENCTQ